MTNQDKQAKLKMEEAVAKYTGPITKIPAKKSKSKRGKPGAGRSPPVDPRPSWSP